MTEDARVSVTQMKDGTKEDYAMLHELEGPFLAGTADLVHYRLDTLFKLPAILGARDHHGQIKHHNSAVGQDFRDVVVDD